MVSDKPGNRGFTLIELLVTLSIAAILAAIALPSFDATIQRNRISITASNLQADLAYARSEAVRRGRSVALCPATLGASASCNGGTDWATGWIVFVDQNGNGALDADESVLRQRSPERNLSVSPLSGSLASASAIRALPVGEFSQDGVIRVCKPAYIGVDLAIQRGGGIRTQPSGTVCA